MRYLHFGNIDIPYSSEGETTTGDVAGYLENKYGVQQAFYDHHADAIVETLIISVEEAFENFLLGGPGDIDVTADGLQDIQTAFKQFLSSSEIEGYGIEGVPTEAALAGVNHRKKAKKNKRGKSGAGGRRPSFIDTGQYQATFTAWMDDKETTP